MVLIPNFGEILLKKKTFAKQKQEATQPQENMRVLEKIR